MDDNSPLAMTEPLPLEELPRHVAVLLDLDGTLLDLAPGPDQVVVPPNLPVLLDALAKQLNGALALVSGRPLPSIDALLRPFRSAAAGLHGTEIRLSAESPIERTVLATSPRAVVIHVPALSRGLDHVLIEDKGACLAIHHRFDHDELAAIRAELLSAMDEHAPDLELLEGRLVLEIKPRSVDKGTACARLLATPAFAGRTPIYFGDDTTDLDAFRYIDAAGGWSVGVGPRVAGHTARRLTGPSEVLAWLRALGDALRDRPR